MPKKHSGGRPKLWRDEAQRKQAYEVRQRHPEWSNSQIKEFLIEVDGLKKEQEKREFERLLRDAPVQNRHKNLDKISLLELIDENRVPTGYISSLSDKDWINYYLNQDLFDGGTLYDTQIEISEHFDANLWAAADVWRGVGKTMDCFGKIIRKMCDSPNIKLALITEEASRSIQRVAVIKHILKTNKKIIVDYGYLPHDKAYKGVRGKWSSKMLQLKRNIVAQEPSLIGLSQGATDMLGYHFDGCLIDDPWSTELQRIKGAKDKWMNWFTETFLPCMEKGAFCWVLFTRKGVDDLYSDIIYKKGLFTPIKRPAIIKYPSKYEYVYQENGLPVIDQTMGVPMVKVLSDDWEIYDDCHGRFTIEYLLGKKKQQGNIKFEQEYQCNPMPMTGGLLDWKALQFYNIPGVPDVGDVRLDRDRASWIAFMDQGFGTTERSDYSVITVMGFYSGRIYFDQIYRGRWTPQQKMYMIKKVFQDYPNLTQMGIESGLIQTWAAKELINALEFLPLIPVDQRGKGREYNLGVSMSKEYDAKILRIHDQWMPVLVRKGIWLNKQMDHLDEFEKEFRNLGNAGHDDIMDSSGSCLEMLNSSTIFQFFMDGTDSYSHFQMF